MPAFSKVIKRLLLSFTSLRIRKLTQNVILQLSPVCSLARISFLFFVYKALLPHFVLSWFIYRRQSYPFQFFNLFSFRLNLALASIWTHGSPWTHSSKDLSHTQNQLTGTPLAPPIASSSLWSCPSKHSSLCPRPLGQPASQSTLIFVCCHGLDLAGN